MNILLLGSGGREHALAWKLAGSSLCSSLFIAPGNAGTAQCGTNVDLSPVDFEGVRKFCSKQKIGMVIVGPEEPLVKGIVDFFATDPDLQHIPVIGPSGKGALLEGSKAFSKKFMERHQIPTASYREFSTANFSEGITYLQQHSLPIVLKADGLAAGKGVVICQNHIEAVAEFELMLQGNKFGEAGSKVVVEEFLYGIEMSVFVLTDGRHYVVLPEAKDYKRVGEGDKGPNTGGMGAVSPVPFADEVFMSKITQRIIVPTVEGLAKEDIDYKGFIFIGIIKVGEEPYVIEYNCRMGDPETEVVMPRLKNDLAELFLAVAEQRLDKVKIEMDPRICCTIVAVSGGYPGSYEKGLPITGLEEPLPEDSLIFHAGTRMEKGEVLTNGGRVLCVSSFAETVYEAVDKSRDVLEKINYEGIYYRRDIGYEFL
ncbi:phosphoribosylamine--glycine ligase [Flavitalea sp. BT771]|uniref:phosphoribosylamine--glycine ligase n=1 Tax=Flavitalea sp. BT771 TaxID=3063329 RepID=UPI0026E28F6D|nr:phosphoribosylamine--glycine ligase [Flavitalea sp. BT771]MDO6434057.1 phosphoribosylamine--glycine ligase [Flavitalea sp. BT771]MDV6222957.1 phosphoribosylamine--glycine ligase [Flavitalea sp. BT771]